MGEYFLSWRMVIVWSIQALAPNLVTIRTEVDQSSSVAHRAPNHLHDKEGGIAAVWSRTGRVPQHPVVYKHRTAHTGVRRCDSSSEHTTRVLARRTSGRLEGWREAERVDGGVLTCMCLLPRRRLCRLAFPPLFLSAFLAAGPVCSVQPCWCVEWLSG